MKMTIFLAVIAMMGTAVSSFSVSADPAIDELKDRIKVLEESDREKSRQLEVIHQQRKSDKSTLNGLLHSLDAIDDRFHINGFMSMGIGTIDEKNVEYGRTTLNGGGGPDFNSEAYVGVQMDFVINESTEITTQLTSKGITQDAQLDAEWFYLKYRLNDKFVFQMGRLRVPFYMLSEYKEVGFAYPWVRPPLEVYDAIPVDKTNGFKIDYRDYFGGYEVGLQMLYSSVMERGKVSDFDAERFRGVTMSVGREAWTFGLGHFVGHVSVELTDSSAIALTDGLETASGILGVETPVFIDEYDELVTFADAYFKWDDGTWQLLAEFQRAKYEGFFADFDSYYVSIGRRFGKWNPYIVRIGQETTDDDTRDDIATMLAPLIPLSSDVARLSAGIQAMSFESQSMLYGLGYEITPRIRAKLELQVVSEMNDTLGPFKLIKDNTGPIDDKVRIISFVIDTVF